MKIAKNRFVNYVKNFQFAELFNELGWDYTKNKINISVNNNDYQIQAVAEKCGFIVYTCKPIENLHIPDFSTRKKIHTQIKRLNYENLIIFIDDFKLEQIWFGERRFNDKNPKITEIFYKTSQSPEMLFQRTNGLVFSLEEEDSNTIIDVVKKFDFSFNKNSEKLTKKFFDEFKKEHGKFLDFIKGIDDNTKKDWYASLMLNTSITCAIS